MKNEQRQAYEQWLEKLPAGDPLREELLSIKDDEGQIYERFYKEIEFGTAGLRGICAAGTSSQERILMPVWSLPMTAGIIRRNFRSWRRKFLPGTAFMLICSPR